MGAESIAVDDLLAAVLDGTPIDWSAIESSGSDAARELVPYLKIVAAVARAHGRPEETGSTDSASAEPFGVDGRWGGLEIIERVGHGAFGEVYRAWDPRLARDVALKLLRRGDRFQSAEESAAIDEGRLLARVRHPNVVTVHGADRIDGRVGIWMEFLHGSTLSDLVRSTGRFSAEEATRIGVDLCGALAAVHEAGMLHRDIKARNVLRERDGRVVLMDFGAGHEEEDVTSAASRAGTPLYLAPEIIAGQPATAQSDIYSLGVLLYHLVTGDYPVQGASTRELYDAHALGTRKPLRDARADLPDAFVEAVERALRHDPRARYRSAALFGKALTAVITPETPGLRRPITYAHVVGAAAIVVASAALLGVLGPRPWRDRLLAGWFSGPPPGSGAGAVAPPASQVLLRKVDVPGGWLVGRPSADGRLFSYSDDEGQLALFDLSTARSRRLTTREGGSSEHTMYSTISADGGSVAYMWWALDGKYEMRVMGTDGREPRVLLHRADVEEPRPVEWSRDGSWILSILSRKDGTHQLALVAAEDGSVRPVRELGTVMPLNVSLSPDGAFVVYDAPQAGSRNMRDVFVVGADGRDPRVLQHHPGNDVAPIWSREGDVIFTSDRSGAMDVWRIAMTGREAAGDPELVHRNVGRMTVLGLTDQGRYYVQLLVGTVEVYSATLTHDGHAGRPMPLGPSFAGSNISSLWSPDGRYVAYASRRGLVGFDRGDTTLVVRDLKTGEQRELVPAMIGFLVRSWSPDGRRVIVPGHDAPSRMGLFAIDVETGGVTPFLVPGGMGRVDWVPGQSRFLYGKPGQGVLLFHDPADGKEEVALDFRKERMDGLSAGIMGRGFKLSPDGRTLALSAATGKGDAAAVSLRVKTGDEPSRALVEVKAPERIVFQDWTPDGAALLFTRSAGREPPTLWRVSAEGGEPQSLGLTLKGLRDVSVHPGGGHITFTAGWPALEVWVIENVLGDSPSTMTSPSPPPES